MTAQKIIIGCCIAGAAILFAGACNPWERDTGAVLIKEVYTVKPGDIINASMRCMMARTMEREENQNCDPEEIDALREENKELWAELNKYRLRDFEGGAE